MMPSNYVESVMEIVEDICLRKKGEWRKIQTFISNFTLTGTGIIEMVVELFQFPSNMKMELVPKLIVPKK